MTALSISRPFAARPPIVRQLASFGAIGLASTLSYVVMYAWLCETVPSGVANVLALLVTAVGNASANRWLTFGMRGREGLARHHAAGLLALAAALVITSASLLLLGILAPRHGRIAEVATLVAANALATMVRFLFLRSAVRGGAPSAGRWQEVAADRTRGRQFGLHTFTDLSQSKRTQG
jgi:putative flippase GtrA